MERLVLALILVVVAIAVAAVIRRRTAPSAPVRTGYSVPDRVDRGDFGRPEAPWLVVAFSSSSCLSCAEVWQKVMPLESADVAVEDVSFQARRQLHERYAIDAVPLVLVADADGTVQASYVGSPPAADLWAKLATLRSGGETRG